MASLLDAVAFASGGELVDGSTARSRLLPLHPIFCEQQRRHSAIGYISPAEYERIMAVRQAA